MITVLEALIWGANQLQETSKEKKTDAHRPQLDTELLLSHVLEKSKAWLFTNSDHLLTKDDFEKFRSFIKRRKIHEPVSQILNSSSFYGRNFTVNRHVLSPRPETEEMVSLAVQEKAEAYFDIGTGSGAIAVTLQLETGAKVFASDVDPLAVSVASKNSERLGARVNFKVGYLLEPWVSADFTNSVIVANLPYIPKTEAKNIDPDVIRFEPKIALFSGHDGADLYIELFDQISELPFKSAYFETDILNIEMLKTFAEDIICRPVEIKNDLSGRSRFLIIR